MSNTTVQLENAITNRDMNTLSEVDQEKLWIEAAQQGDTLAFNRLVLKWEQRVYNTCYRVLRNRDDAAEITQEAFLAAYRNICKFKKEAKFSTWIYRIAVNRSISRLRKRPIGDQSISDSEENPALERRLSTTETQDTSVFQSQKQRMIHRSLGELGADQRAVVELKFFQEMTFEEIADVVETPVSTVKSRFYTALDNLRGSLSPILENRYEL